MSNHNGSGAFDRIAERLTGHSCLSLTAGAFAFLSLGFGQDGLNLDSTTYSVIARNMAELGRWFNPTYTPFYHPAFADHPVFVVWIQGIFFKLFGASDSVARLHGALFTLGSVLMIHRIAVPLVGRAHAIIAGITLLLTYNFMQMGNSPLLDGPMTFFILIVLWGISRMDQNAASINVHVITGLALGASFLSKGVVSAPIWIALAATALFRRRDWMRSIRFWIIPAISITMILLYLFLDDIYAGGHFRVHYFETKVWDRFLGGGGELENPWYFYSLKFAKLYLPFSLLLPFGLYTILRDRMVLAFPLIVTMTFFVVLYSGAARVYYHYFMPMYALCAPVIALAVSRWLSARTVRRIAAVFLPLWLISAIGVTVANVRIHEIRSPEIYELTDKMNVLLSDRPAKQGLVLDSSAPDWDYIAKTSWYWRSDILQLKSLSEAEQLMKTTSEFAYLLIPNDESTMIESVNNDQWHLWARNSKLSVFVPSASK